MKHLILILLAIPSYLFGQVWEKSFGSGTGYSVEQTTDSGFIAIGTGVKSDYCVYLVKTDRYGDTLWTKHHKINTRELYCSGHQTTDGGYIITGATKPTDSFGNDVFLLKTDNNGDIMWSKEYGGNKDDIGYSVQQTMDGGYIITGWTESFSLIREVYLIKTDSNGETMWTKTYGDDYENVGQTVQQTNDGGYFITGTTFIMSSGIGWVNLIRTDSIGDIVWTTTFDELDEDFGQSGQQTNDGGFIITGTTETYYNNNWDVLLMKVSASGEIDWVRIYGDENHEERGNCVQQTIDGGYIITGSKKTNNNSKDVYLMKTDSYGDTLWTRTYGGENLDEGFFVQQTTDGGYIITGVYQDNNDIRYVYLIKTDENGIITFTNEIPATNPNKKLIKTVDLSGREIAIPGKNTLYIEIYDDGTSKKKLKVE
ncbi:MAG: hypothetical protein Q8S18_09135 [Bacteroidales bacterium]|nr:hypothetical protein [Bacteroidales bacterium]